MGNLQFQIRAKSFYQAHSEQAHALYQKVLEFADLKGDEVVYDLYTGTGTIACFLAQHCKKVVGIECVEDAIADAKENALLNNINNIDFFVGDIKEVLSNRFIQRNGCPEVVVLDPPRAGIHPDVIEKLQVMAPEKIIYVSCNPATQARDLSMMKENYEMTTMQPVDMFPHTHHVENIVLLKNKK